MSRRSAQPDISIYGDELEARRAMLEHNLQHTDLSLHLSSRSRLDASTDELEYPRHAGVPSPPFSAYASFDHRSGDDFDPHEQSRFHAWSYHTDDGIQPYAHESLSTAHHHASALTINAGLGGGRGQRRDLSLSGAEYDPDRPLNGIIAGIAGRFTAFDANSTRSRQITASAADFDPLVVDDTAELDRVLQSGHAPAAFRSSHSSSASSSDPSEPRSPQPQQDSRPRLSDALNHLTFSPKRPRSAQGLPSPRLASMTIRSSTPDRSAIPRHVSSPSPGPFPTSTPRPQRYNTSLSYAAQNSFTHPQPEVNIQPATPSIRHHRSGEQDQSSKFTAMARGLKRDIAEEADAELQRKGRFPPTEATPKAYHHSTLASKHRRPPNAIHDPKANRFDKVPLAATPFKKTVHLPDMTGLTSAVASPAKVDIEFYGYDPKETTEIEGKHIIIPPARLIATLTVVQNKLGHLEAENSVSRRRVRELELELEACKKEVARERTRIMEHEQSAMKDDQPQPRTRVSREKLQQEQRQKSEADQAELAASEARYKNAVEEKKALESLISTLRSHLTRLTAELSEHKQLLLELRQLRESDARTLAEKSSDVDRLRQEVERLAGEVEVLRGVVEEGLKERRGLREQSVDPTNDKAKNTEDSSDEESDEESVTAAPPVPPVPGQRVPLRPPSVRSESSDEEDEEESAGQRSPTPSPKRKLGNSAADKTMRTDFATVASSQGPSLAANISRPSFLGEDEVSRIAQEVSARRSERSIQSQSQSQEDSQSQVLTTQDPSPNWSRNPAPAVSHRPSRVGSPSVVVETDASGSAVPNEQLIRQLEYSVRFADEPSAATSRPASPVLTAIPGPAHVHAPRPSAPTPGAAQKRRAHTAPQSQPTQQTKPKPATEGAFPQIRGERLERLFFSAPAHDAETCTVCHRRRRRRPADVANAESWLRDHAERRADEDEDEDEGFVEGDDDRQRERKAYTAKTARDRVPPQTVLARVLRELEDDFTHYKGIYVELADQYKDMDPVSNVVKRNVLADHLREVIDVLEQKGNQIASLYDLLTFKDKPLNESVAPEKPPPRSAPPTYGRRYPGPSS
ncbi:uncharacterized protein BXZ73DRAFT_56039 [Epithele typhae]|uniref:uncharacterized protein n=1 Tax=Epithele typhae TaxID=378194 RepID=UPI002007E56C|nr:uncharacterized protein BXZ73DRAFT_56039 [Epithele typhae]KAH9912695.1 hypothetical protein BXZ73DRAFT_56039 [Epithele typhae]